MLLSLLFVVLAIAAPSHFSVLFEDNKWVVKSGKHFLSSVADAEWEDLRNENGWTRLKVRINKQNKMSDNDKFFGAGYLEGFINQRLIFAGVYNVRRKKCKEKSSFFVGCFFFFF
jgi:hypothetical protein